MKFADLTDCVSACAGDHDISHGKQIRKLVLDIFILDVSGSTVERFISFSFSAEMNNLEFLQKFREDLGTLSLTEAAPRLPPITISTGLSPVKPQNLRPFSGISGKEFLADRSSCKNCFVAGKIGDCLRKITADSGCRRETGLLARPGVMSDSWIQCGDF